MLYEVESSVIFFVCGLGCTRVLRRMVLQCTSIDTKIENAYNTLQCTRIGTSTENAAKLDIGEAQEGYHDLPEDIQ
jgi:hypothetical protein